MTVKGLLEARKGDYNEYELYYYIGRKHSIHTDCIASVLDEAMDAEVVDYSIMDEEEYNSTVLANSCMFFKELYEKDDKVLVIIVDVRDCR